jgi:hypothetical protein
MKQWMAFTAPLCPIYHARRQFRRYYHARRQFRRYKLRSAKAPFGAPKIWAPGRIRSREASGRNTQRATLQTPQGLDATHGDELFPVNASTLV